MAMPSQKSEAGDISIHVMERTELEEPRRIFRVAFGTFIGVPEPQTFWADREYVFTRWQSDPQARSLRKWMVSWQDRILPQTGQFRIFWSFDNPSAVLGSGHSTRASGSDHGPFRKVTRETGLFTFAHSAKRTGLYQKFGFWPRFLTAIPQAAPANWTRLPQDS